MTPPNIIILVSDVFTGISLEESCIQAGFNPLLFYIIEEAREAVIANQDAILVICDIEFISLVERRLLPKVPVVLLATDQEVEEQPWLTIFRKPGRPEDIMQMVFGVLAAEEKNVRAD